MARPGNTLGVSVMNTYTGAADAVLANGTVTLTGLPDMRYKDIISYVRTAYAAGTLQQSTVDYGVVGPVAALVPVVGTAYKIVIAPNFPPGLAELSEPKSETYIVVASTAVLADLTAALEAAIDANTLSKFTAGSTATTVVIDQKDFTIEGFTIRLATNGNDIATGTPYVKPSGSPAEVESTVPPTTTVAAAGTFDKIVITIDQRKDFDSAGDVTAEKLQAIIWADVNGPPANYVAWNAAITDIFDGTYGASPHVEYNALV